MVVKQHSGPITNVAMKLKKGDVLRNFGSGWWIGPAPVAYKRIENEFVENSVVDEMAELNLIKIELKTRSSEAYLIK